jgi:hypothetical protein
VGAQGGRAVVRTALTRVGFVTACTHCSGRLLDPSGAELSMYYARLIGYLKNGHMKDERGEVHSMPPGQRRFNFTVWEVFNEFEQ